MFSQPLFPVTWYQIAGEPFRPVRSSQLPNLHPSADGYVALQTTTGQQWLDFCTMIGREDWYDDERLARGTYRTLHRPELEAVIDAWTSTRATAEIVELATLLRIPVAEVGNGATLPKFPHLVDGGWFVREPGRIRAAVGALSTRRGRGAASPRAGTDRRTGHRAPTRAGSPPFRRAVAAPSPAEVPLPLAGVRIIDLTAFWAGPIIGYACAVLGAEVIHVESTKRPDGIRLNGTRPMSEPQWWEWCPMFQGANTNKLDLAVELDTERGRELLLELVDESDVLLDNFSPRVLEQWGLDQTTLLARNPALIVLRAPAYGITGPWRERLAYAPTIEAQAGVAWISGFPDRGPEPPSGVADAMGGAHATVALLLGLEYRRRTGRGMFLECPMVGASLNLAAEQIVEHSASGRLLERRGNRSASCVPQGVYLTADADESGVRDRWVAISVATDEQWSGALRGRSARPTGPTTSNWRRSTAAAAPRTSSTPNSPRGAPPAPALPSCTSCRLLGCRPSPWCVPTSMTRTSRSSGATCSRRSSTRSPAPWTSSVLRFVTRTGRPFTTGVTRRFSASTTATCSEGSSDCPTPRSTGSRPRASSATSSSVASYIDLVVGSGGREGT